MIHHKPAQVSREWPWRQLFFTTELTFSWEPNNFAVTSKYLLFICLFIFSCQLSYNCKMIVYNSGPIKVDQIFSFSNFEFSIFEKLGLRTLFCCWASKSNNWEISCKFQASLLRLVQKQRIKSKIADKQVSWKLKTICFSGV